MTSSVDTPDYNNNHGIAHKIYLSALVPVYNEAGTIEEIVRRLEQISIVRQIVVVDDGSLDETPTIVKHLSDAGQVVAYFHARNYGKGAALRHALELAKEDYLVIQDADLEYDPQDFYTMARAVQEKDAQVVYGSRFLSARRTGMLWSHYFGNRFLTIFFNVLYGQRLTDMETCYKLFRTDLLQQLGIDNDRFDIDPELTAKIVRAGHKISEVPVSYAGRPYLAGKKIKPIDALSAIKTLWDYRHWQPKYLPTKRG
jgi:glycosyltransferase involved in cell wall biosynthesis